MSLKRKLRKNWGLLVMKYNIQELYKKFEEVKSTKEYADYFKDICDNLEIINGLPFDEKIAEELEKVGHKIVRKIITVKGVKEVGSYSATVKLHKEVSVEIPFVVVAEAE